MSKIVLLSILYIGVLLIAFILPEGISDYNAYVLLLMIIIYLFLIRRANVYRVTSLFAIAICIASLFHNILYVLLDCALIFFLLGSVSIGTCDTVKNRELHYVQILFLLICLISIAGIFIPALYQQDDGSEFRYAGLFHKVNVSACIFSILAIAVWEIEKRLTCRLRILLLLFIGTLIYIWTTGTRSLLFVLPYWMYQLYAQHRTRKLVFVIIGLLLIYFPIFIPQLSTTLRLDENESSLNTRSVLYWLLWQGILDNYAIIPHGVYASNNLIVQYTLQDNFSPHNDILKYIYDWGFIFYIFCAYLVSSIKRSVRFNFEFILILLVIFSFALHNMMFSIYIWIPFIVILMVRRSDEKFVNSYSYEER